MKSDSIAQKIGRVATFHGKRSTRKCWTLKVSRPIFFSNPGVLPSFISRFALVRWQIDSYDGMAEKKLAGLHKTSKEFELARGLLQIVDTRPDLFRVIQLY